MNVILLSDLHREFRSSSKQLMQDMDFSKLPKDADICILAGDIGHPLLKKKRTVLTDLTNTTEKGLSPCPKWIYMLKTFKTLYKYVLYVPGNHEYYQAQELKTTPEEIDLLMKRVCKENDVIFLNCDSWKHPDNQDMEFFGCTLWSNMKSTSWDKMNDSKAFATHSDFIQAYHKHFRWLEYSLTTSTSKHKFVITHYLPSRRLVHPRFLNSNLNDAFATSCDHLFKKRHNIKAWFYGHTHEFNKQKLDEIPFYCNPLGYPSESRWTPFSTDTITITLLEQEEKWQDSLPGQEPIGTNLLPEQPFSLDTASELTITRLRQSYGGFLKRLQERKNDITRK